MRRTLPAERGNAAECATEFGDQIVGSHVARLVRFCVSLGDRQPDVYTVGAPVVTADGAVLAFNCGGMPSEVTAAQLENEIGPRLARAARQISMEASGGA